MKVRSLSLACEHVTEMLLILKKYFRPDYSTISLIYDRPKKCPMILYTVNLWLKPVSATGTRGWVGQVLTAGWDELVKPLELSWYQ